MSENNEMPSGKKYFSPEKIKELDQLMIDKVAEVMRLQEEGILPYASKIPKCHVERRDICMILERSYSEAGRIMADIRKERKKKKGQYISVEDFCAVTGLSEHAVQRALDMCPIMDFLPDKMKKPSTKKGQNLDAK